MKLMIFDANSIINRAFYGVRLLSTAEGLFTNAIYGYLGIHFKFIEEEKPDCVCAAFDLPGPTFRHERFDGYKAGRRPMPDELAMQIPIMKEVLTAMGVPVMERAGFEADDIIGSMAAKCEEEGMECIIITGDKDDLQLVSPTTRVRLITTRMGRTDSDDITVTRLFELYGLEPWQMIELKALMGDSSDNIPGVKGVGEKTAMTLIQKYGSIDNIYKDVESLDERPALKQKLIDGKESAYLSRELGRIKRDVPLPCAACDVLTAPKDDAALYRLFEKLEFKSFITRLGLKKPDDHAAPKKEEAPLVSISEGGIAHAMAAAAEGGEIAFCPYSGGMGVSAGGYSFILPEGEELDAFLREIMASPGIVKVAHDIKGGLPALYSGGVEFEGEFFDTMIAAYILDPAAPSYDAAILRQKYLLSPAPVWDDEGEGAARRACDLLAIKAVMEKEIEKNGQERLFYKVEMPLCFVLFEMERVGFKVDREALYDFGRELDEKIRETALSIYKACGSEFNINSTKQLGAVLFEQMGLPVIKKTKTGPSTDNDVLVKLSPYHEVVSLIIEYRHLTKLKSTYIDGLLPLINEETGRIHTSFNQTVTQTGRISSTEPNLQNIPVRLEMGRRIRRVFVPESSDYVLIDADYSQIELRLLAHIADDEVMKKAFKEGVDIHTLTACQMFGVAPEAVTADMRSAAKTINFSIVYGIGDFSLADDLKISRKEARAYIDAYFATYSGVKDYMERVVREAERDGFVTTLLGRRRYLPELKSKNHNIRQFGRRCAMNTPIQGTAADIIKLAMVRVSRRLKEEGLYSRLILQVHDELIVEAKRSESAVVARILKEEMEGALPLSVELLTDMHEGDNWLAAKA